MSSDPIADMLTRIRNANMAHHESVSFPASRIKVEIVNIMKQEGFITDYEVSGTGIERMKALRLSTDGFYIAEQDLKTRGPGELNGTLQSGALEFKIADLNRDMQLMQEARADAIERESHS